MAERMETASLPRVWGQCTSLKPLVRPSPLRAVFPSSPPGSPGPGHCLGASSDPLASAAVVHLSCPAAAFPGTSRAWPLPRLGPPARHSVGSAWRGPAPSPFCGSSRTSASLRPVPSGSIYWGPGGLGAALAFLSVAH